MGKLFSRPKAPALPQIVYDPPPPPAPAVAPAVPVDNPSPVYQPTVSATPAASTPAVVPTSATSSAGASKPDPETQASEARVQNLLNRRRGRAGTVETSWRGVLEPSGLAPQRKTLLGD